MPSRETLPSEFKGRQWLLFVANYAPDDECHLLTVYYCDGCIDPVRLYAADVQLRSINSVIRSLARLPGAVVSEERVYLPVED